MRVGDTVQVKNLQGNYTVISYSRNERNIECVLDNGEFRICIKRLSPNFTIIQHTPKNSKPHNTFNSNDPSYYLAELTD
jgi:hypothetical protein